MRRGLDQKLDDSATTQVWSSELRRLIRQCLSASPPDDPTLLHDAYHLLCQAPEAAHPLIGRLPDQHWFESLLVAGAYESAAFCMLPTDMGYVLSRGPGHASWLASSCQEGRMIDVTCRAGSAATALLSAYLSEIGQFLDEIVLTRHLRLALN